MDGDRAPHFESLPHPAPVSDVERAALLANPDFGRVFTDHMVTIRYGKDRGWHDARIEARQPLTLDPAAAVLHYAQEIFEGLKAYQAEGGGAVLFRPDANARRFAASADRLAMPALPDDLFVESVRRLVSVDRAWIPTGAGSSLYLRPFMIAGEAFLGVKPATDYLYMVIASPVGSYFKGGAKPISIWVSRNYTRAAPGGTGAAKCGGNYASSLPAQAEAIRQGCDQVVFLDVADRRWVEELGGMNLFFAFADGSLQTPPLGGTILPGITRDSILTMARAKGLTVREAPYAIDQWRADAASGRLREAFACGTAAVIAPIGRIEDAQGSFAMPESSHNGGVADTLRLELTELQRGARPDPHGWVQRVF